MRVSFSSYLAFIIIIFFSLLSILERSAVIYKRDKARRSFWPFIHFSPRDVVHFAFARSRERRVRLVAGVIQHGIRIARELRPISAHARSRP